VGECKDAEGAGCRAGEQPSGTQWRQRRRVSGCSPEGASLPPRLPYLECCSSGVVLAFATLLDMAADAAFRRQLRSGPEGRTHQAHLLVVRAVDLGAAQHEVGRLQVPVDDCLHSLRWRQEGRGSPWAAFKGEEDGGRGVHEGWGAG